MLFPLNTVEVNGCRRIVSMCTNVYDLSILTPNKRCNLIKTVFP